MTEADTARIAPNLRAAARSITARRVDGNGGETLDRPWRRSQGGAGLDRAWRADGHEGPRRRPARAAREGEARRRRGEDRRPARAWQADRARANRLAGRP